VDFEEDGVREKHGASISESVPPTADFLLWISCCEFRGGWGSEGSTALPSLGQYPMPTVDVLLWTSRRMGVRGKHGASISESVPPTVDQATRLRIHLTAVKGALTGERTLWESRAEALTLSRDVLLWTSRRMGSEGSTGLLSLSQYPYCGTGTEVEDSPHSREGLSHWRAAPVGVQGRGPHSP
jgi:hypothetical protein